MFAIAPLKLHTSREHFSVCLSVMRVNCA